MSGRGRLITLEGIDGAGKTTHVPWIRECIEARGVTVVTTREPGGTPLGEALRELLLHEAMTRDSEVLLMFAARREHLERVIRPALSRGDWVLCDRFTDATFAYQGGGHGVAEERIAVLESWVHDDCQPDRTILFDVSSEVSQERLQRSHVAGRGRDKFEREDSQFFDRVRQAYIDRARAHSERFRVVDSVQPLAAVRHALEHIIEELYIHGH
ncbi:MAG: dTMP kinase [Pseudomonadota bacterium]|nr:dTMP kinase [Pseudomonadota bacterium]